MAKRKRGGRKGFTLKLDKDYRSEQYTMYVMKAETGILQAATMDPTLTDGDVDQTLAGLINRLKEPETLPALLAEASVEDNAPPAPEEHKPDLVQTMLLANLQQAFTEHGPLEAEDVSGILDVIRKSIKRWGQGMHRRGYLTYIEGFLAETGVQVQKLSTEETKALGVPVDELEKSEDD